MPSLESFQARLAQLQVELRDLRTAAFVDYAPAVCGLTLRPITFASYLKLAAFGNSFVCGGPVTFKDIFQFVWVHHPAFGQEATRARHRVLAHVHRTLTPRYLRLNGLAHVFAPILTAAAAGRGWARLLRPLAWGLRKLRRPTEGERYLAAATEIRRLVNEALHDFPAGSDEADPLPYAQKPHFVALLIRGYGLDFITAARLVDELPLKQLLEYVRETIHRLSAGKNKLLTRPEAHVWAEYLAFKTEALNQRN